MAKTMPPVFCRILRAIGQLAAMDYMDLYLPLILLHGAALWGLLTEKKHQRLKNILFAGNIPESGQKKWSE